MDFSGFGSLMGQPPQGQPPTLAQQMAAMQKQLQGVQIGGGAPAPAPAAPAVPGDGAMQPTIGAGAGAPAPAAAPAAQPTKFGMPPGGLLGLLQGKSPQGLMGLLNGMKGPAALGGSPLAAPGAGMLSGLPGTPGAAAEGPVAPAPQLPMNINPMDQF